ncbi:hypothetical protein CPS_2180 [Colwellia psychrerythraea 34H]|uniref:Uncharacterized protein n=1 Tax=Colwellia psychrerythraea (strain 34H / ATCC BAA-681) TaxID=167879 RepID=Q482W2_COLP3|nr:hypothetical protein CPS_2180 [Colwellia psychrerythraea 34H]
MSQNGFSFSIVTAPESLAKRTDEQEHNNKNNIITMNLSTNLSLKMTHY